MAGVVAARAPWRDDRSPSHLSDSTRVSSDPPPAVHPTSRDDDPPRDDVPPSSVLEVEDLLASLRVAPNQVAGHSSKGVGLPSLVDDSGHFLKPAPDDRKGVAELAFYERVWKGVERDDDDDDDDEACSRKKDHADGRNGGKAGGPRTKSTSLAGIAPFVPKFHGVLVVDPSTIVSVAGDDPTAAAARDAASRGQRAVFLRLEDVTAGFRKPCVIDLKVGLRTYSERGHDSAYVAKRSAHDKRSGQFEVGFKVCGMQTWERRGRRGGGGGGRNDEFLTEKNEGWAEIGSSRSSPPAKVKRLRQVRSEGPARSYPDGWIRNTRPYSWARGLCTKEDARRALEEFVGLCGPSNDGDAESEDDDAGCDSVHCDEDAGSCDEIARVGSSSSGAPAAVSGNARDGSCSDGSEERVRSRRAPLNSHEKKNRVCKEVYSEALRQIASMRAWFATQRELHLLGSSVLIVYEGDRTDRSAGSDVEGSIPVRVKAIDFCNYVEGAGELDTNFGAGLDRLSVMLESIVAASGGSEPS